MNRLALLVLIALSHISLATSEEYCKKILQSPKVVKLLENNGDELVPVGLQMELTSSDKADFETACHEAGINIEQTDADGKNRPAPFSFGNNAVFPPNSASQKSLRALIEKDIVRTVKVLPKRTYRTAAPKKPNP